MKVIKRYFLMLILVGLGCISLKAQGENYGLAGGLRLGLPLSLSLKKFVSESDAFEGYFGFRNYGLGYNWVNVSGAYQKHFPIKDVENLFWYVGGGASMYFFSFKSNYFGVQSSTAVFGLQAYLGLDYLIPNSPVNISLDWVPSFFFTGVLSGVGLGYGNLGVRYTLAP